MREHQHSERTSLRCGLPNRIPQMRPYVCADCHAATAQLPSSSPHDPRLPPAPRSANAHVPPVSSVAATYRPAAGQLAQSTAQPPRRNGAYPAVLRYQPVAISFHSAAGELLPSYLQITD